MHFQLFTKVRVSTAYQCFNLKKKHSSFFLCAVFNCLKNTEPIQGESSFFTFRSPEVPGTHFIKLERMKAEWTTHWF